MPIAKSATILEQIGADLGAVSQRIFGSPAQPLPPRQRINSAMQQNLIGVGQTGEQLSRIRESLLGLGRLNAFLQGPPEPRSLSGAMFGKSGLHRVIHGA